MLFCFTKTLVGDAPEPPHRHPRAWAMGAEMSGSAAAPEVREAPGQDHLNRFRTRV